jgi:hypothetical protein
MGFTIIFATHKADGFDMIGHAWVAVEYPKHKWTVRGFYPKGDFSLSGFVSQAGVIMDDYDRLMDKANLRTRTYRGLTEEAVHSALKKIIEYGGRLHPQKYSKGKNKAPRRLPSPDVDSDRSYGLLSDQCCIFAVEVCKAAGVPPFNGMIGIPVNAWFLLGGEGIKDAQQLPRPFGSGED